MIKLLWILSIALLHVQTAQSLISSHVSKHVDHVKKDLIFTFSVGDNITYAHAICDRHEDKPLKYCILSLEILIPQGLDVKYSCDVEFEAKRRNFVARKFSLTQFNHDSVVFVGKIGEFRNKKRRLQYYKEFLNVRLIHMPTCKYKDYVLKVDEKIDFFENDTKINNLNVVPYKDGTFDLFFKNSRLCGKKRRCRLTYNSTEERYSNPAARSLLIDFDPVAEVFPIYSPNSTLLAYVTNTYLSEDGTISLLNPDGDLLYSHEYSFSAFEFPIRISNLAVSSSHGRLGFCQQSFRESTLDCSLFDHNGNGTLGLSLSLKTPHVTLVRMYNLEDGGFAVAVGYKEEPLPGEFIELDFLKIDDSGSIVDVQEVMDAKCPLTGATINVEFFERAGFEYCYYTTCTKTTNGLDREDHFDMEITSQCFRKESRRNRH